MIDQDGSFAKALRTLFEDVPDEAIIGVGIEGGGEIQIGDMTWDTDPTEIVISAYMPPGRPLRYSKERRFDTLPELWAALHPEEGS